MHMRIQPMVVSRATKKNKQAFLLGSPILGGPSRVCTWLLAVQLTLILVLCFQNTIEVSVCMGSKFTNPIKVVCVVKYL